MTPVDIDRWHSDPYLVERIHAAARRERAEMVHRFLARFGAWLGSKMRAPSSGGAHVQGRAV